MYTVYKIKCNNKCYIGQTKDYKRRIQDHTYNLRTNKHCNRHLQEDYNKYGIDCLEYEILEECESRKQALERETYWINYYGGIESDKVYNFQDNITENAEMRYLVSNNQKGKPISQAQKDAVSRARLGVKDSYSTRLKKSKARLGSSNPNYGNRKYTEDFITKLRCEYKQCGNYSALSRKYNITACSISNLIKYGITINPNLTETLYKKDKEL